VKHILIFFGLLSITSTLDSEIEIKLVQTRYLLEEDFIRIQEYLKGKEFSGRRLAVRTQSDRRTGLYFVLTLSRSAAALPNDTMVRIEVLAKGELMAKSFEFKIPLKRPSTRDLFLGLTGSHWPNSNTVPLAWNISLIGPSEEIIDQQKSFLWE
tara:strand:+ start:55043 stop:55504 length:462 start_codon:yes stop_codon:yes gene_type:complete